MYEQGMTQSEIARELGVHKSQITRDMQAIRKKSMNRAAKTFESHVESQLNKLEMLEAEAWAAFEESRKVKKVTKKKGSRGEQETETVEMRPGDPRYLKIVNDCIAQRNKILGLNAPTKRQNLDISIENLPTAYLERIVKNNEDPLVVLRDYQMDLSSEINKAHEQRSAAAESPRRITAKN